MVVLALVGVVLLQKSEGGGLGMGGGGGFMSARGTANVLTRTTAILAAIFFGTSLALSMLAGYSREPKSILDTGRARRASRPRPPAPTGQGILDQIKPPVAAGAAAAAAVPLMRGSARLSTSITSAGDSPSRRIRMGGLKPDSHGAVHLHHRRRGLLAWQGSRLRGARRAAAGARLQGPPAQARPLSQRRSGHDEPVSARRGVRHRRRGRDRPRPRPLRALHRRPATRTDNITTGRIYQEILPRSGAATISAPPCR